MISKMKLIMGAGLILLSTQVISNPYPDENLVPKDAPWSLNFERFEFDESEWFAPEIGEPILRVDLDWNAQSDKFIFKGTVKENSGTSAYKKKSTTKPKLGSYIGILVDPSSGKETYFDSVGTGKEYRKLARAVNFRFPMPDKKMTFVLLAEDPQSGVMNKVLTRDVDPLFAVENPQMYNPEISEKIYKKNDSKSKLIFTVYAEGYKSNGKSKFDRDVNKLISSLRGFPGLDKFEIKGVFGASNKRLGKAPQNNPPKKIKVRDSFLGMYYPFWDNFGRWYHVIYATDEKKYHNAIGASVYDYPFIIVDDSNYWGVGNFMSHTAVPADNSSFKYLVWHEMGHFLGLNEEYNSGGRTELEFAPGIKEPWSQNITFAANNWDGLKWNKYVSKSTRIPTRTWSRGKWGAYLGGYAQSKPSGKSHIPGKDCVMSAAKDFCKICAEAIKDQINYDLGNGYLSDHSHQNHQH